MLGAENTKERFSGINTRDETERQSKPKPGPPLHYSSPHFLSSSPSFFSPVPHFSPLPPPPSNFRNPNPMHGFDRRFVKSTAQPSGTVSETGRNRLPQRGRAQDTRIGRRERTNLPAEAQLEAGVTSSKLTHEVLRSPPESAAGASGSERCFRMCDRTRQLSLGPAPWNQSV